MVDLMTPVVRTDFEDYISDKYNYKLGLKVEKGGLDTPVKKTYREFSFEMFFKGVSSKLL